MDLYAHEPEKYAVVRKGTRVFVPYDNAAGIASRRLCRKVVLIQRRATSATFHEATIFRSRNDLFVAVRWRLARG